MPNNRLLGETIITPIDNSMDKKRNFMAIFKFCEYCDLQKSGIL